MITLDFNELYSLYETEKKTNYQKLKNEYPKLDKQTIEKINDINEILKLMFKSKIQPLFKNILESNKTKLFEINTNNNIILLDKKKYIIKKDLGEGYFSQVKLVSHNNHKYACKIQYFSKEHIETYLWIRYGRKYRITIEDDDIVQYLTTFKKMNEDEYNLLKTISKHNIGPKVYNLYFAYDTDRNNLCSIMIMEYLDGETLINYGRKKKITDEIKTQISNKIKKLHELNIIHQDLHQNNIMIVVKNKKVFIYLIDLGLSIQKNNALQVIKNKNYFVLSNFNGKNNHISDLSLISFSLYKSNKINIIS